MVVALETGTQVQVLVPEGVTQDLEDPDNNVSSVQVQFAENECQSSIGTFAIGLVTLRSLIHKVGVS